MPEAVRRLEPEGLLLRRLLCDAQGPEALPQAEAVLQGQGLPELEMQELTVAELLEEACAAVILRVPVLDRLGEALPLLEAQLVEEALLHTEMVPEA